MGDSDLSTIIRNSRMRPYQYLVVLLGAVCTTIDGFDMMVIGFALPHLPPGFATPEEKGLLISAAMIGMGIGAILIGRLADRFGRRNLIFCGLAVDALAMLLTALAPGFGVMMIGRLATGVGIGIIATAALVLIQEYSSAAAKNFMTAIYTLGVPLGGVLAGAVSLYIIDISWADWRTVFLAGSAVSLAGLIACLIWLPESPSLLIERNTEKAHRQLTAIRRRLGIPAAEPADPVAPETTLGSERARGGREIPPVPKARLMDPTFRNRTIMLCLGYTAANALYIMIISWTPQLVTDLTGEARTGTVLTTINNLASLVGAVIFGVIGWKVRGSVLTAISMALAVGCICGFAMTMTDASGVFFMMLVGTTVFIGMSGYNSLIPPLYPPLLRGRAYGTVFGVSRVGTIVAPALAGYTLSSTTPQGIYFGIAALALIAALAALYVIRISNSAIREADVHGRESTSIAKGDAV